MTAKTAHSNLWCPGNLRNPENKHWQSMAHSSIPRAASLNGAYLTSFGGSVLSVLLFGSCCCCCCWWLSAWARFCLSVPLSVFFSSSHLDNFASTKRQPRRRQSFVLGLFPSSLWRSTNRNRKEEKKERAQSDITLPFIESPQATTPSHSKNRYFSCNSCWVSPKRHWRYQRSCEFYLSVVYY